MRPHNDAPSPAERGLRARAALRQTGLVGRRSVRRTLRQPAQVVPTVTFPLILLAVNSSGLAAATRIPGFPAREYLDFAITVPFMQGALFGAIATGTELATDIETGFFNRLQLTPLSRVGILAGQLAGAAVLSLLGAMTYLLVGLIAGVSIKAGVGGALLLLALAVFFAVGFSAIGALMAARTGSSEAVQGLFPLLFVSLFLSSMSLPRNLIEIDWFRTVATWNPVSYLVEALRSLVIAGWDGTALWRGIAVGGAIGVLALTAASRALATRMERT